MRSEVDLAIGAFTKHVSKLIHLFKVVAGADVTELIHFLGANEPVYLVS